MRIHSVMLVAFAAAAGINSAQADDFFGGDAAQNFQSNRLRQEVVAELQAFKRSGINPWSTNYDPLANFHGTRTRAEIQAEYFRARDEVAAMTAEDSGSQRLARRTEYRPVFSADVASAH